MVVAPSKKAPVRMNTKPLLRSASQVTVPFRIKVFLGEFAVVHGISKLFNRRDQDVVMSLLVLSAADVDHVLIDFSPFELQYLMARVFGLISALPVSPPMIHTPHRSTIPMQNHTALFMPARVAHPEFPGTTLKAVSVPQRSGDTNGLPGSTIVMNEATGAVKALVNSRSLTAFRNAAGSLLSTTIVGIQPTSVVAFGAGKQIDAHLELHLRAFPALSSCTIVNRNFNDRVIALSQRIRNKFPAVTITVLARSEPGSDEKLQATLSTASLIICATSATAPLFPSTWVRTGAHVVLVGSYTPAMREVDQALIRRAVGSPTRLLVDSKEACAIEAGELIDAKLQPNEMREIGECIRFEERGEVRLESVLATVDRLDDDNMKGPITMFKSVGVGLQDVAIACAVVARAEEMDIGTKIPNYDL
ncbi:hypothetical protein H0H87_007022 [Tephrocybe sp. NHM501043]|nr:hypothetical protein H0H87_007022 [Tephrocybe sp. NHM501043]